MDLEAEQATLASTVYWYTLLQQYQVSALFMYVLEQAHHWGKEAGKLVCPNQGEMEGEMLLRVMISAAEEKAAVG